MFRVKWNTLFWSLSALGGLYAVFVSLLLNQSLQRNALYAQRFHTAWWHDIDKPEAYGFAEGQVLPFRIRTADNESLYAWHIIPVGLYALESTTLQKGPRGELDEAQYKGSRAFELLRNSEARVIINSKNAGHVAQGWRTDAYKSLSTADSSRIHILTFDYRGFGKSTGTPTEEGLIRDAIAVVNWALDAGIAPHRILLVGHSLGAAVAVAATEHFAVAQSRGGPGPFAGLLLCAGFSDIPNLMKTYMLGGIVPVLSPLQPYPRLQRFFAESIADSWWTDMRLRRVTAAGTGLKVRIVHARNDFDIGWRHADALFGAAVDGLQGTPGCVHPDVLDVKLESTEVWDQKTLSCGRLEKTGVDVLDGHEMVSRTILRYGGHNRVLTHNYLAVVVRSMFDVAEKPV